MNGKQLYKANLKANFKEILFVCCAFFVMVLIACLSVSAVIKREMQTSVSIALGETEKTIQSYLREPKIAFENIYLAAQDMLDKGESQEALCAYLTRITNTAHEAKSGVQGFIGVYGFVRDEFIDSINLNPGSSFIPQQRPWYQLAIRSKEVAYTAPYTDAKTGESVISLTQELYGKNGEYYGVLSLDVNLSWLIGYAKSLELAKGGYGMITNQYLYLITHPEERYVNRPLQEINSNYAAVAEALRKEHKVIAHRLTDYNGASVITFFRELYNGWYIGVAMPVSSYYADLYRTALFLIALGILLSAALSYLLLRLSAAKMRSDEENRTKSSFLAMMSHEIRTPLNAIIGLSEIQMQKKLAHDVRADIETIHDSGTNLLGIINDILDFSKLDAGGFSLVPAAYDLPSLINDTVQLNMVRAADTSIQFFLNIDPSLPARLLGDELRVKQVLNNLLSNAFKYTAKGSVTLSVGWRARAGKADLLFAVSDTGIGIKKDDMAKLFTEYGRFDLQKNRSLEGTGLGLAIIKRLVTLMGGSVSVESEYGKGSTFSVSIEQEISDATPVGEATAANLKSFRFTKEKGQRSRQVQRILLPHARALIVDDIMTNLDVARGLLAPYAMAVDCLQSGSEAVEAVREAAVCYDIIFMDHMMPGMDGIEATRVIREEIGSDYAKTVPIVALTANAIAGNEEMFIAKGFNGFVSKPINIIKLDDILKALVVPRHQQIPAPDEGEKSTTEEVALLPQAYVPAPHDGGMNANAPSHLALFRAIDGLDVEAAMRRYGEDENTYLSVLRSFAKHTPGLLENLKKYEQGNLHEYAIAVHGLKGSSAGISADAVACAAESLEYAAKNGDAGCVASDTHALVALTEKLLADLSAALELEKKQMHSPAQDILPAKDNAAPLPAIDEATLAALLEACKRFDAIAMEDMLTQLESAAYKKPEDTAFITALREQLDQLEYDSIQEMLEKRGTPQK